MTASRAERLKEFQILVFYSQVTFGLNAARLLKAMELLRKRPLLPTENYIVRFAQAEMIQNAAKIWDHHRAVYGIQKIPQRVGIQEQERARLEAEVKALSEKHAETVGHVTELRNNVGAHLNKRITSVEKLTDFKGEVSAIQDMLNDVKMLTESLSWFPKGCEVKTLDYDQIVSDLRLNKSSVD